MLARRKYEVLALALSCVFCALHWSTSAPVVGVSTSKLGSAPHRFVQSLEGRVTNLHFRVRGQQRPNPNVVVVELDEAGADRWGLWPWPRDVMAGLLDKLLDADVKVIGLDMVFTDQTTSQKASQTVLEALAAEPQLSPGLTHLKTTLENADGRLAQVLRRAGPRVVQGVIPFSAKDLPALPRSLLARYRQALAPHLITQYPGTIANSYREIPPTLHAFNIAGAQTPVAELADLGNLFGHFESVPDADGTIRQAITVAYLKDPPALLPALALQVAAKTLDAQIIPQIVDGDLDALELRSATGTAAHIPVLGSVTMTTIDYPGPLSSFAHYSAVDVVDGTLPREALAGKSVLIGVTITGSFGDQRVTPWEELTGGVVTHAALLSNILDNHYLDRPWWAVGFELAFMVLLALLLAVVLPRVNFSWKIIVLGSVIVGWSVVTQLAFSSGVMLAWVVPTLHLVVTSFALTFLGYVSVDREKSKLRTTFSRYLGEDVIDVALSDPETLNRGEKREMTVLFSDIRGFTTLAERMSPETLVAFINEYLSPMTRIVFDEKGTLDKYIGDALMAFWNAPLHQPDHALRACRAAVHMLERLDELKVGWRAAGYPELDIGIGINTGVMVVGNLGSDVRVDYTVLGDAVNLGSRLEGTNKQYDTRIVIGENTWAQVREDVVVRRLGSVRVVGRREPVRIYELLGIGRPKEDQAAVIRLFDEAVDAWSSRRFDAARQGFEQVLVAWPNDPPARKYLAALDRVAVKPPGPEWDGVMQLDTK